MATMNVRCTYALDNATAKTIKALARHWQTSQAEVVRRSVKLASEQVAAPPAAMTPVEVIAHYRKNPPARSWAQTQKLMAAQRKHRRTQEALLDVDGGCLIGHQAVQAWADSLSTKKPQPTPRASWLWHTREHR